MNVLALIPARAGSKGIPDKNFKSLAGGPSAVERAIACAVSAGVREIEVSSDCEGGAFSWMAPAGVLVGQLYRPSELAQDDTPMVDVVKHALAQIPGPDDQIILLLQPTQPLRQPKHLTAAIELLQTSGADSVVSVVELPLTHSVDVQLVIEDYAEWTRKAGPCLRPARWWCECGPERLSDLAPRRQELKPTFIRDGTCYAFTRSTVAKYGNIYGQDVRPLVIPASESCPLDEPADWARAEEVLRAR